MFDDLSGGTSATTPLALSSVVADYLTALGDLGIVMGEPFGYVSVDPDCRYFRIGTIVIYDDGTIEAIRCINATATQVGEVLRQAESALFADRTDPMWRRVSGAGWEASILEPVDASGFAW